MKDLELKEITNPEKSIFVSANAGSGKTFILVARVLGLLLKGEDPSKILCISFTESASNEMRDRIIQRLKNWHKGFIKDDLLLLNESPQILQKAQKLYTEVVLLDKMPKILTFHSFCMQVIRAFSAESGLLYKPSILSSSISGQIKRKIFKNLIMQPETRAILEEMKFAFSPFELENSIIPTILQHREKITKDVGNLYQFLGIKYTQNHEKDWIFSFISSFPFQALFNFLQGVKNVEMTDKIKALEDFSITRNPKFLEKAFIGVNGDFLKKPPISTRNEASLYWFEIRDYYIEKMKLRGNFLTAKLTENLMLLISQILKIYKAEKEKLEAMDFDDIIFLAKQAFEGHERDFILFKLDGGVNHVLVDEAQDTNFTQWGILGHILEEFFSGSSVLRGARSLFIVGDEKQSIFSFQGSQPEALNAVFKRFSSNLIQIRLQKSYRTSQIILDFVDTIFSKNPYKDHISKGEYQTHFSSQENSFGRVEIMPILEIEKTQQNIDKSCFLMPWQETAEEGLKQAIAKQISNKIILILSENRWVESEKRPIKPCDFMLLSQFRDAELFLELKKNLLKSHIDVSFGDKILLEESLILNDFISLLKVILNPKDTLSLANVLRSPIFAFEEAKLHKIFTTEIKSIQEIEDIKPLLNKSIEGFFIAVFAKFSGKYSINEIKEFSAIFPIIEEYNKISSSCNFEGFIMFFEKLIRQKESFKLEKNSSENAVKISTVHASKGLESPIIFILNATEVFSKMEARENLIFNEENQIFLLSKKKLFCEKWLNAKEKEKSTKYAEYIRLFYVALTRAKEEIYIFPKKLPKTVKEREESWYEIAQSTLPDCILSSNNAKFKEEITIIEQIPHTFVKIPQIPQTLQIREKATENIANSKFTQTGSVIHEMLEGVEFKFKLEYFLQKFSFLNEKEIITLYNKSLKIRTKFPFLFTQNTFSEVEIIQEIGKNSIFSGKIDKIIISSEILIYDFKLQKNPKLLQKTHTQLEKYKIAMAKIYPKHAIKCFILWINSEEIEEITHFLQTDEMHLQLF